ncbi:MAG: glycosyltransferase [Clostridia bacterium]|nr:glycosyltransferase [Clostridia bacterium]
MNTYNPLVSIIIPVYNGGNYMREAIDSALSQTYKNIEIIVVNDGSTDDGETESIALSYGDKIKYYKKENGGCASALNYGISKMQGEWFSWLSHDDVYLPEKIQSAIDCINEKCFTDEKTIIICSGCVIDAEGKEITSFSFPEKDGVVTSNQMFDRFMMGRGINGCALLIPKSALDKAGKFSTTYVYILDWIYWIELSLLGYNFYEYSDVLVKNRRHSEQVSVKKQELLKEETEKFILELIDRVLKDSNKLYTIWLYCTQIRLTDGCKKISNMISLPISVRIKKIYRRAYSFTYHLLRKLLRLIKK